MNNRAIVIPPAAVIADHDFFCVGCETPFTNIDELAAHDGCAAPWYSRPHREVGACAVDEKKTLLVIGR